MKPGGSIPMGKLAPMTAAERTIRIFTLLADPASVSETTDHLRAGPMIKEAIRLLQEITGPEGAVEMPKTAEELQKAHDILVAIILDEVPHEIKGPAKTIVSIQCDVLCWALGHAHNEAFGKNLATIMADLEKKGLILKDSRTGRPSA